LAVDHNKLHSLHGMALKNCSVLEEIRLNGNILTQVGTKYVGRPDDYDFA
jgi:hypothetical protein